MSPRERYSKDLQRDDFVADAAQQTAVAALQKLYQALEQVNGHPPGIFGKLWGRKPELCGIYLWGGVGRGKTYLMDLFYESLAFTRCRRVHYHKFMLDIHQQLRVLPRSPNPLPIIARSIAREVRVLCLDEFHVTDIADAMLLAGLLRTLFEHGVVLLATSNTRIDDLYLNGLQRERFLEVIALLKTHTQEIELSEGPDYRLAHLESGGTYLLPEQMPEQSLEKKFFELAPGSITHAAILLVHDRPIRTRALSDDVAWFDFHELCDTPRAAKDYLELARQFHTVIVSDIPSLGAAQDSAAKRFMHLVDALYDHRVKLIASAAARPEELYRGRLLQGAFDRTVSRLVEMSSHDYLALAHRP